MRINDRHFRYGDKYILREITQVEHYLDCPYYDDCEYRDEAAECGWGEDEAIDMCGDTARKHCYEHKVAKYTGREMLIEIKDIFHLRDIIPAIAALENDYVVFTFKILWQGEV